MGKNLISIDNLHKEFPSKVICERESLGIFENEKIGILGVNGCGKTTFLKILDGSEAPDSGNITLRKGTTCTYLPQIPILDPDSTIYQHIYNSDHPEFRLLRKYYRNLYLLEIKPTPKLEEEHKNLMKQIESQNAWRIEIKAKSYLTKLGFDDIYQKISTLSGGQRRRVDLARVLMDQPDILLLDEPTNHLDIDTIEWFQNYLANYNGSVIFVTHDRYFLDAVTDKIMEIDAGKIRFYKGNYSYYIKQKEMEKIDKQRKEIRRKSQLKKELKWLKRGAKARTSKPKDHVDRVKELLDKSYLTETKDLDISFQTKRMGKTILNLKSLGKKFGEKILFENFSHNFQKMERIGILGANGCGKTSLLKIITGELKQSSGSLKVGVNTSFSYFKQHIKEFDDDQQVIDYIKDQAENIRTKDGALHSADEMLQRFLFSKKQQQNKIGTLSGGEKKRLYLLRSLMFGSNFIIMDEPTNDLDIKTLEILEDYLDAFKGCILIVSHDRYFLDRTIDHLFIFEDNKIVKFPGNYSDYLLVKRFQDNEKKNNLQQKSSYKKNKTLNKLSYNETRELKIIEKEIPALEENLRKLDSKIENDAAELSASDFDEITKKQQNIRDKLDGLERRWLELSEKKERLENH